MSTPKEQQVDDVGAQEFEARFVDGSSVQELTLQAMASWIDYVNDPNDRHLANHQAWMSRLYRKVIA